MEALSILTKYTKPTKYNNAPRGTLWKRYLDDSKTIFYIQTNKEKDEAEWILLGDFLQESFLLSLESKKKDSEEFIQHCLQLFFSKN